jgi:hypothetical protein
MLLYGLGKEIAYPSMLKGTNRLPTNCAGDTQWIYPIERKKKIA